ncbi:MAG: hypothetical protein AAFZ15_34690 [Bacteroidota bacterium]
MQYSAEEVIQIINSWDEETSVFFYRLISSNITISIRVVLEDEELNKSEKLEEIKSLNEFHHKLLSWFPFALNDGKKAPDAAKLFMHVRHFAEKAKRRGAIEYPVASAFETTKNKVSSENN